MARIKVFLSEDAGSALRSSEAFLAQAPVENNLVLTILHERADHPEPGRYWMVSADGRLAGFALQSPPTVPTVLATISPDCIEALAHAIASDRPSIPGVFGEASTAARFAGFWAERLKLPVAPDEAVRLYRLNALQPPPAAPGSIRTATQADFDLILEWMEGFKRDTGAMTPPPDTMRRRLEEGLISIWHDGSPVSMASVTTPLAETVRVALVYTPPEYRGRGYAASCVAAVSQAAFDAGARHCMLFTQLSNPQSNAIYRRLGYEPVQELLRYRFGS